MPFTSRASEVTIETSTSKVSITPKAVRPYSKLKQQRTTKRENGMGKSGIYTPTPEKQRIEKLQRTKDAANF